MAREPREIQREIHEIRGGLDDVADELNRRVAAQRRRLSPRYLLQKYQVAASLAITGLIALGMLWRGLRRRRRHRAYLR